MGSKAGKKRKSVAEINPLNVMMKKKPLTNPSRNFRAPLYPCSTPIEALEILAGPGVKVVIRTNEISGNKSMDMASNQRTNY